MAAAHRGNPHWSASGGPGRNTGKPEYDPARRSLAQREQAKAAELVAVGEQVTARTVKRKRQRYEAGGVQAVVDHRLAPHASVLGRADPPVVAAIRQAIGETVEGSTRTIEHARWRTEQILTGAHVTGSARTRRSLADQPEGPFHYATAAAPGELMQIDSTPLDVLVMLDDGVPGRVELTGMVDLATRTITAAVIRPTTKAVDASLLLARTLTPEPMRPGWTEALTQSCSYRTFCCYGLSARR